MRIIVETKICPMCEVEFTYDDLVNNLKYQDWGGFRFPARMPNWRSHKYCSLWCSWASQKSMLSTVQRMDKMEHRVPGKYPQIIKWLRSRKMIRLSDISYL